MGTDQAVRSQKAEVIEWLPTGFVWKTDTVLPRAAGSGVKNFIRLRPGDRVRVKLSARDKIPGGSWNYWRSFKSRQAVDKWRSYESQSIRKENV